MPSHARKVLGANEGKRSQWIGEFVKTCSKPLYKRSSYDLIDRYNRWDRIHSYGSSMVQYDQKFWAGRFETWWFCRIQGDGKEVH